MERYRIEWLLNRQEGKYVEADVWFDETGRPCYQQPMQLVIVLDWMDWCIIREACLKVLPDHVFAQFELVLQQP